MTKIKKNITAEEVLKLITDDFYELSEKKLAQFLADMLAEPVEEWEPEHTKKYWYLDDEGYINCSYWASDDEDCARRDFLGVYPNEQAAEEALQKIKSKLRK